MYMHGALTGIRPATLPSRERGGRWEAHNIQIVISMQNNPVSLQSDDNPVSQKKNN